ncbi:MAG: hypothetical protein M3507_00985 [Actinomycetota bacterium]|nr:hypothetical protein [Actinomycetota bacterium]
MSLVVLVILAMVWAVFLVPQLFRARAERSTDSIGNFRRQLMVLERTSPARVVPNPHLRATSYRRPTTSAAHRPPPPHRAPAPRRPPARTGSSAVTASRHPHPGRAMARKRRRDIFCGLLVAIGASLVLSLIPAMRMMLWVHLALDVAFVAYVVMLVRARNLATERDLKVRFLPTAGRSQPQLLLQRSAN